MNEETEQLIELIRQYGDYKMIVPAGKLTDFAVWMLNKANEKPPGEGQQLNRDIGYYLNRVNRYARLYAKLAFRELPIKSLDEFSFLTVISRAGQPSKSEVYEATLTEITTGAQLIKRLIALELVEEIDDEADRRVKRVKLTQQGETVQQHAFEQIGKESGLKLAPLAASERTNLLAILKRMDQFHQHINQTERMTSFEHLLETYVERVSTE